MLALPGYVLLEQIQESPEWRIYKGVHQQEGRRVIVKIPKEETAFRNLSRLVYEYEIMKMVKCRGMLRLIDLKQLRRHHFLIMEDVGVTPFHQYLNSQHIKLDEFLNIGIGLAEILHQFHQHNILLGGITPEKLLYHVDTRQLYVVDLADAVFLPSTATSFSVEHCQGEKLAYLAPEQTGRLKVGIDQRSDLYSLGVFLYRLITGVLPIQVQTNNFSDLLHAIITFVPPSPDEIKPGIPPVVSTIVMKLMDKSVENRYQTALGVLKDLTECQRRLTEKGKIEYFPVGTLNPVACLQWSDKLHGRELETDELSRAFQKVCTGQSTLVLISGDPGVGKTMLVNRGLKPLVIGAGYFIAGKFDQLVPNVPYAPFTEAFRNLIKQLMTESKEKLEYWKKRITGALGRNGAVITQIVPELEKIIGKQPPLDELAPKEAENRFFMVFKDFVRVFARQDYPLVLFLDDLQWTDAASLKLLQYLVGCEDLGSVLIVGAFRENEVPRIHPLRQLSPSHHIILGTWSLEQAGDIIAEILGVEPDDAATLSEKLYRKTAGNPLYLCQMLRYLYGEGVIFLDDRGGRFKWHLEKIPDFQQENDLLPLFLDKLERLPGKTCDIIKLAACIGSKFDLGTLSVTSNQVMEEVAALLVPAVKAGLILPLDDKKTNNASQFEFLHDRVQQAAYSLLPDREKKLKHLEIGRLLLNSGNYDPNDDTILTMMDHFNRGLELVCDSAEKLNLVRLNLLAGQKARSSAAYDAALAYFRKGKQLLPEDAWEHHYSLTYDLYLELAQGEYLVSNVEVAENLFDTTIRKASTELERADVYGLKVILYAGLGEYTKAVSTGIKALERLGVKLPLHPTKIDYLKELLRYKWNMHNKTIEELLDLPEVEEPVRRKITELLSQLSLVTMLSYPDLFGFVVLKAGNYAVQNGNTETSSVGYFGYSITTGIVLGDYRAAARYAKVCIELVEKYDQSSSKCIIYFVVGALISHWVGPVARSVEYLLKAAECGTEAGNLLIIGYTYCLLLELQYLTGVSLRSIAEEARRKHELALELKHDNLQANAVIYGKLAAVLQNEQDSLITGAVKLKGEGTWEMAQRDRASLATFHIWEMQLYYLAGDYKTALTIAHKIEALAGSIMGFMINADFCFYYSLAIAADYRTMSLSNRRRYGRILHKNLKRLKKWSYISKDNFAHKYFLVAAEKARLENKTEKAMKLYDEGIYSAGEKRYIQNEALGNEMAAKFYMSLGLEKVAQSYMEAACRGYYHWGAFAKVRQLKKLYPHLLDRIHFEKEDTAPAVTGNLSRVYFPKEGGARTNFGTPHYIEETMAAVAQETDFDRIFKVFLEHTLRILGADKGYLILEKSDELYIELAKSNNRDSVPPKGISLEEWGCLAKTVVRYVVRTLETVIWEGELQSGIFAADPYIAETNPGSIVCLPLLLEDIPFGVLYFEHSLIKGAFTTENLEIVKLLVAQTANLRPVKSYLEEEMGRGRAEPDCVLIEELSRRELEVLQLIAAGFSNREIAHRLNMTVNTVKTHIKNIYGKLSVHRRVQAVEKAKQLKIL